jgi:predicted TIM-barrel fold metal-dependent hydrolase
LKLAARFPQIHFVAAHLGLGVFGAGDAAIEAWAQHPLDNVWFDMGTLRAFVNGAVETLLTTVGPDRLCFGTDSPLYTPAPFVRLLETLDTDDETREKIAWRNAVQAFPRLARTHP